MKRLAILLLFGVCFFAAVAQPVSARQAMDERGYGAFWERMEKAIESHLKRPYVWGACGLKSFDCSGFVWRVMYDSGVLIKRTTARKLYMALPSIPSDQGYDTGTLVFFNNLKHCGIVANRNMFYHAESSIGTNLSQFDPYWRPKVFGFRSFPKGPNQ